MRRLKGSHNLGRKKKIRQKIVKLLCFIVEESQQDRIEVVGFYSSSQALQPAFLTLPWSLEKEELYSLLRKGTEVPRMSLSLQVWGFSPCWRQSSFCCHSSYPFRRVSESGDGQSSKTDSKNGWWPAGQMSYATLSAYSTASPAATP